jgi:predicted DCC family thiol-disulfide oxidoreductase YuxK
MTHDRSLEVWYDGQCPLCRASRDWCTARDLESRLIFRDLRTAAETELPVARSQAEAAMWVRGPDGTLASGFSGWRRIMAELPGWRWLARAAGVPPASWLGPLAYRLVARSRRLLLRHTGHGDGHGDKALRA